MRKGNVYEINITETEFPGYGVGEVEGHKVYVRNALPGQKINGKLFKKKGSYAEANLIEVLEDVDYKIDNKCLHFNQCGGCTHQMISYEKQIELKQQQVLKLLNEASIDGYEFLGIEKSPEEFEYRNKMEFTFGDYEKGGDLTIGMHVKGKTFSILTVDSCEIVDDDFRKILSTVLDYFREKKLPYYRVLTHQGYLRNLVVRKTKNTGEILINLVTTTQLDFDLTEFTNLLLQMKCKDKITGIIHTLNDSLADMVQADEVEILFGRDYIIEDLLGLKFKISPFSFFQTNSKGAEKLYSIVREFLGNADSKIVFDLYCGTGTIGQIVAPKAKKVLGIELIEEAVVSARENSKLNNLTNCEFIAGDVAKVIQTLDEKPDVIILDPPRAGVHPTAMDYVIKFNAPDIVYVSCNPKSLANDLKVLTDKGYKVEKVKLMDMFPHTPHVECVVGIRRKDSL